MNVPRTWRWTISAVSLSSVTTKRPPSASSQAGACFRVTGAVSYLKVQAQKPEVDEQANDRAPAKQCWSAPARLGPGVDTGWTPLFLSAQTRMQFSNCPYNRISSLTNSYAFYTKSVRLADEARALQVILAPTTLSERTDHQYPPSISRTVCGFVGDVPPSLRADVLHLGCD